MTQGKYKLVFTKISASTMSVSKKKFAMQKFSIPF